MPALEIIFVGVLFAVAVNIFAWPRSKKGGRSCSHNAVIRVLRWRWQRHRHT
jgi:hypothetical protein